ECPYQWHAIGRDEIRVVDDPLEVRIVKSLHDHVNRRDAYIFPTSFATPLQNPAYGVAVGGRVDLHPQHAALLEHPGLPGRGQRDTTVRPLQGSLVHVGEEPIAYLGRIPPLIGLSSMMTELHELCRIVDRPGESSGPTVRLFGPHQYSRFPVLQNLR